MKEIKSFHNKGVSLDLSFESLGVAFMFSLICSESNPYQIQG